MSFKTNHARLLKLGFANVRSFELNVEGPKTLYDSNHDWSLAATYVCTLDSEPWLSIQAQHGRAGLAEDSLLIPALAVIRAVRPGYAVGYSGESNAETCSMLAAVSNDDYPAIQRRRQAWRRGLIPEPNPWNFLSEEQLMTSIDDMPLLAWITAVPGRGAVAPACEGLSLWSLLPSEMKGVFGALWRAGVIFDPGRHADDAVRGERLLNS